MCLSLRLQVCVCVCVCSYVHEDACATVSGKVGMLRVRCVGGGGGRGGRALGAWASLARLVDRVRLEVSAGGTWSGCGGMRGGGRVARAMDASPDPPQVLLSR